jgi:hypothetical protein
MKISKSIDDLRSLTYSLDACHVGFYFWLGSFSIRIGGVNIKESTSPYFYPYVVPTFIGFGLVLPNYVCWHTPFKEFTELPSIETKDKHNGMKQKLGNCQA